MCTETEENQTVKEKEKQEKSKIFQYFKAHPTVFITCISGLLAIASGIINMLIDAQVYKTLHYWGFSGVTVDTTNTHWFYRMILFALIMTLCFLTTNIVSGICKIYFKKTEYLRRLKQLYRIEKGELKSIKKDCKKIEEQLCCVPDEESKMDAAREKLASIQKLYTRSAHNHKKASKELKHINYFTLTVTMFFAFAVICIIYYLICALFSIMYSGSFSLRRSAILGACLIIELSVVPFCCAYFDRPRYRSTELKELKTDSTKLEQCITRTIGEAVKRVDEITNPIPRNIASSLFSNVNMCLFLVYYIVILGMIAFLGVSMLNLEVEEQTSFDIFTDAEKAYAIVYANNGVYYMDEAEINGDSISINTEKHRVFKSDDIQYEVCSFSKVYRKPEEQAQAEEPNTETFSISKGEKQ